MKEYNKYIGKTVTLNKVPKNNSFIFEIDHNDSIIKEIKNQIALDKSIVHSRFWTPGKRGTMDARKDRINIVVNECGEITRIYIG